MKRFKIYYVVLEKEVLQNAAFGSYDLANSDFLFLNSGLCSPFHHGVHCFLFRFARASSHLC